jgi:hypothetical protein
LANAINMHSAELQAVSLQLCIAMSALVLQWTEWENVLQDLGDCAQVNMIVSDTVKNHWLISFIGCRTQIDS